MDPLHLIILALVQGITEFLPISSSAHLVLVPVLSDWDDQGLAFDIAVHVGTLLAVVAHFRVDIARMVRGGLRPLTGGAVDVDGRLGWLVVMATIPVGLAGLAFKDVIETGLRSPAVIAWASIGFGLLLWFADRWGRRLRDERTLGWRGALAVGLAQALALIPGTSRSGITMTAGLALGLDRVAAARFSFLLSIPVIALAGGLQLVELAASDAGVAWGMLIAATLLSAVSAWACIHLFLRWISRIGMLPFVLYRVALGVILLILFPA
jgi:undecaprenyl-diphosphatase